jgi:hypothetical protein
MNSERYFQSIKSTIQFNASLDISKYQNYVNESTNRAIFNKEYNVDILTRTPLFKAITLENKFNYIYNIFLADNVKQSSLNTIFYTLKGIYTKERVLFLVNLNLVKPDLSQKDNYLFVDIEGRLTSKNKKIEYFLRCRNLTNNRAFKTVYISDYFSSKTSRNLNGMFLMLGISFKL